jgi:hypothetical protein
MIFSPKGMKIKNFAKYVNKISFKNRNLDIISASYSVGISKKQNMNSFINFPKHWKILQKKQLILKSDINV